MPRKRSLRMSLSLHLFRRTSRHRLKIFLYRSPARSLPGGVKLLSLLRRKIKRTQAIRPTVGPGEMSKSNREQELQLQREQKRLAVERMRLEEERERERLARERERLERDRERLERELERLVRERQIKREREAN